jgi:hypothetical protein
MQWRMCDARDARDVRDVRDELFSSLPRAKK